MIKRILLLALLLVIPKSYCQTDAVQQNINKIKTVYLPKHSFGYSTFNTELEFIADSREVNSYRNFFEGGTLNGKVKKATRLEKLPGRTDKEIKESTFYDADGYKTEIRHGNRRTEYSYDEKRNMVKEVTFSGQDTTQITQIAYNERNQIIRLTKKKVGKKNAPYDLYVTIDYDNSGRPVLLQNNHPVSEYSFVRKISYYGNIVKDTESSNDGKVDERTYWYSKDNKVLKYQNNKSYAAFSEYNSKREIVKETVYENETFSLINTYSYNGNGDIIRWTYSNNPKEEDEIHDYEIEYDSFQNRIYSKKTDNVTNKNTEVYYEYEYF